MLAKLRHTLELVRFSHSIFALPYALGVMIVAAHGLPPIRTIALILAAMVTARTAAMAFNRYLDAEIDAANPRTKSRHLPAGILSGRYVLGLTIVMSLTFVAITYWINSLVFFFSPIALVIFLGYSYCKRFTDASHFVLGLALGIAPVGAWMAVTGEFSWTPVLICGGVLLWVAGFDIIYALQDEDFDRRAQLHSMVVRFGRRKAVYLAFALLLLMIVPVLGFGHLTHLGAGYYAGVGAMFIINALIIRRTSAIYLQRCLPDGPHQGEYLLMLNGLTGLAFLVGCIL